MRTVCRKPNPAKHRQQVIEDLVPGVRPLRHAGGNLALQLLGQLGEYQLVGSAQQFRRFLVR